MLEHARGVRRLDDAWLAMVGQVHGPHFQVGVRRRRARRCTCQSLHVLVDDQREPVLVGHGQFARARIGRSGIDPDWLLARNDHDGVVEYIESRQLRPNVLSRTGEKQGDPGVDVDGAQQRDEDGCLVLAVAVGALDGVLRGRRQNGGHPELDPGIANATTKPGQKLRRLDLGGVVVADQLASRGFESVAAQPLVQDIRIGLGDLVPRSGGAEHDVGPARNVGGHQGLGGFDGAQGASHESDFAPAGALAVRHLDLRIA